MSSTTTTLVQKLWHDCNLPAPGVIALEQFKLIATDLSEDAIE